MIGMNFTNFHGIKVQRLFDLINMIMCIFSLVKKSLVCKCPTPSSTGFEKIIVQVQCKVHHEIVLFVSVLRLKVVNHLLCFRLASNQVVFFIF